MKQSVTLYKRLLGYVLPYWKMVALMLLATAVYASTNALYIANIQPIIDDGLIGKDMRAIQAVIGFLLLITFVRGIGFFLSGYASRWVASQIVFDFRQQMFGHLHQLPSRYYDRVNSGQTLSKFNYDVQQLTGAATNAIITLVREGVMVIAYLSYLLYVNWKMTLIIFVIAPLVGWIVVLVSKRLRRLAQSIQGNMGAMNHILDENIKGHKIVKIYRSQAQEVNKFTQAIHAIRRASIKSEVATALSTPIIEWIIVCVLSLIIWLLARETVANQLTPGAFFAFVGAMGLLPSPIKKLMRINEEIQRGLAASESIFCYLDEATETDAAHATHQATLPDNVLGRLVFSQVSFAYSDADAEADALVLDDFNLTIEAGETVALVGASGSGKSSLVSLIPRFYEMRTGHIYLDGVDIHQLSLQNLRAQIAYVSQDVVLFDDTVAANIAYGEPLDKIDRKRVEQVAELAQATPFIQTLAQGFDTLIGESGLRLSGGQRQRLSIARALYKAAPIIIMDEATSALDTQSERAIQSALDVLFKDRTAIIIAHRLSTVRHADRIVVLADGKIVEIGSHEALMQQQGRYFQLQATLQAD
ncbi:lipid A export permease/ATP-binding protein MsbA [Ostreibacterium oceani]|uniref:Lipid A export permease/ATP-binding protein MsbA n=1 Tax=Ostreibacterium oceani TaxID=2654998 RepID=A0A6N7F0Q6_9GAMM|nr:lipid A export permease/ATP-binding protein MsbA [Ostreibacterium oceani]MPV85436.1 lipid A export permease/ATP-binding protein MsbA [Ostreibacterium oceani]